MDLDSAPEAAPDAVGQSEVEPRLLRALVAVAGEGHFGRAAQRLGLAQPALSRRIQQLERVLGVSLFDRTSQGATLTGAGRAVLPEAKRALAQNRRVLNAARAYGAQGSRTVVVAAPLPSPPGGLLAEAIRRLRTEQPGVRVTVTDIKDEEQSAALAAGSVDVALTWGGANRPDVTSRPLVEERWVAALPAGHPAVSAGELSLEALAGESLLFPVQERRHCWSRLTAVAEAAYVSLAPIPTAPGAVADLVADGLGVSVVPASFRLSQLPGLAFVPLPGPGLSGRMSLLWRRDESAPAVLALLAACRAAAGELAERRPDIWTAAGPTPSISGQQRRADDLDPVAGRDPGELLR
ncbi:LysR family transcriptional regulator [Actinoplanes sp. M2I2]|uniref:LysR family transcriptional regulator n=1 Tax=Actinoplanes sp. M2I2 TaxID=1734444 RepID=UPI0020204CB4|nr:LysR family transcriptional regulator [Actinoplanes sp. M2I2]